MDKHFRIGLSYEGMAERFELGAERPIVVCLAVVAYPQLSVLVRQRLATSSIQIDDAEPPMGECNMPTSGLGNEIAFVVGAAMTKE
jgi:hypothetical protein